MIKNQVLLYIFMFLLSCCYSLTAQEDEEVELKNTRSDFTYSRLSDGTHHLFAKLFIKEGSEFFSINNAEVKFFLRGDTSDIALGSLNTNDEGKVDLYIKKDFKLDTNELGYYVFAFEFPGNDTCTDVDEELEIKDLNIDYEFVDDGEGYKSVLINLTDRYGNAVADEEVYVYVKRLYSLLPIGSEFTGEEGELEVEFPNDLPGDSLGKLQVVIKALETFEYGTVIKEEIVDWGIPVDFSEEKEVRALWARNAPLWMVIAITIVLVGAWSQFFLAIVHLFKMRKSKSA